MITSLLTRHFGFDRLRPGQEAVISRLLAGKSAAAIFPTGAGKSLCYQLPALALPHLTLVISPLLALMHDQLAFLRSKGIAAATLDSSQTAEESRRVMQQASDGQLKILMISVERLKMSAFAASSPTSPCHCWWWTRPTASRSGATTFAPTTSSCRIIAVNWPSPRCCC